MRAHFGLPSVIAENVEGRPPIHVRFEIPYFTVSGIQVNSVFSLFQISTLPLTSNVSVFQCKYEIVICNEFKCLHF